MAVFIGAAMLYTTVICPATTNAGWYTSIDLEMLVLGGKAIWGGHLGQVYMDRGLYALPLSLFVMAPVVGLVGHWHVPNAPEPDRFLIYGPYILSLGVLALHAARGLAWDLGLRRRLWSVQLVTMVLVLIPEYEWGHLEDVLALTFVLYGLRSLLGAKYVQASVMLSLAIASKEWAVMLVPIFVLAAPAGQRMKSLFAACALPALLVGVFMGFDFHDTLRNLTSPVTDVTGATGHPWIDGNWLGAHSSVVNRSAATVLAGLVSWRRRSLVLPFEIMGTVGLILMIRPLTETINYSYYWSPGLLILAISAMSWRGRFKAKDWIWPMAALVWTLPRSNDLTAMLWWAGELVLLAMVAVHAATVGGFVGQGAQMDSGSGPDPAGHLTAELSGTR